MSANREDYASKLLSTGLALMVFGLCSGVVSLWEKGALEIFPSFRYTAIVAAILIALAGALLGPNWRQARLQAEGFAFGLLLVFLSDWLTRDYNFFQGPSIRGELLLAAILAFFLGRKLGKAFWGWYALCSIVVVAMVFINQSAGRPLFSDDNATFIFRLSLLKSAFPFVPFYYPLWNAGMDARDFFATGAFNIFFLTSPLIYLSNLWHTYNWIIVFAALLLPAICMYLAARIEKFSPMAAAAAVLLSFSTGLVWYRWALKYGTLGFITTAALVPLNFALLAKLFSEDRELSKTEAVLLVCGLSLMLCWTPAGLVFLPWAAYELFHLRRLLKKAYFLKIILALLIINLPWMGLFWSVSNVSRFLQPGKPAAQEAAVAAVQGAEISKDAASTSLAEGWSRHRKVNLKKSLKVVREMAFSSNPLILFLAWPGILLLRRPTRQLTYLLVPWLLGLGSLVITIFPQLEFDRMILILTLCLCLPTALALEKLFDLFGAAYHRRLLPALSAAFLLLGPFCVSSIFYNRSFEQFAFASPLVGSLASAIEEHGGAGRTMFAGFILHELSQGHAAPLSVLTGHALIASSQFHNLWDYTEVLPSSFLKRVEHGNGMEDYLELYNVSSVVAHETKWRDYFLTRAELYETSWKDESFMLFKVRDFKSNWFVTGQGELLAQSDRSVKVRVASSEAVLKFAYFPFLQSSACRLSAEQVAPAAPPAP
jgi:hypothetical protein